jgi:hypothetical protein
LPHAHVERTTRLDACGHRDQKGVGRRVERRLWRCQNPVPSFDFGAVAKSSKKIDCRRGLLRRLTLRPQDVCIALEHDAIVGPLDLSRLTAEPGPERLVRLYLLCGRRRRRRLLWPGRQWPATKDKDDSGGDKESSRRNIQDNACGIALGFHDASRDFERPKGARAILLLFNHDAFYE